MKQRGPSSGGPFFYSRERQTMNFDSDKFEGGFRSSKEIANLAGQVAEAMKKHFGEDVEVDHDHMVGMLSLVALQYQLHAGPGADTLQAMIHNVGVCWNAMLEHQNLFPENADDDEDDDFYPFSQN